MAHRIWFERTLPPQYHSLLDGIATVVGSSTDTSTDPFAALPYADAIVAASRLRYDGALMDRAPNLRVIARSGIGFENVSLPDATARGIAVCNAPDAPTISTAEHTVALLLALARDLPRTERELREGGRGDFFGTYRGVELYGRTLGLVGLGRIGSRVARITSGLGMRIAGFDPYAPPGHLGELGITRVEMLEELLRMADVVSLHLPLTPETHHLIRRETLELMRPGAFLINCARGGLVDEEALLEALDTGRLGGAGLDVFDPEPPRPDHPLLRRDDVIATPHIAAATGAGKDRLWRAAIGQALQVLRGERPPHLLNPDVWPVKPPVTDSPTTSAAGNEQPEG